MAPETGTAILVLSAFVLPGFVGLRYSERTFATRTDEAPFERLMNALYFSSVTYLIVFSVAWICHVSNKDVRDVYGGQKPIGTYVALSALAFMLPIALAELSRRWNGSDLRTKVLSKAGISLAHLTPSGWEHFFLQNRVAFVRVTTKDGRVVGGYFGADSFAGYTVDRPDLYLEQRWELDETDWFVSPAPGTAGVYIRAEEIASVEFYEADGSASVDAGGHER